MLINEYSKIVGYKINTQKSLEFLDTNNEKIEREIKETIPFTIAMKRIKYLGIYLPKETKMGSTKDRNGMDLTEAEDIKKRWQEYTEELYKKIFNA